MCDDKIDELLACLCDCETYFECEWHRRLRQGDSRRVVEDEMEWELSRGHFFYIHGYERLLVEERCVRSIKARRVLVVKVPTGLHVLGGTDEPADIPWHGDGYPQRCGITTNGKTLSEKADAQVP